MERDGERDNITMSHHHWTHIVSVSVSFVLCIFCVFVYVHVFVYMYMFMFMFFVFVRLMYMCTKSGENLVEARSDTDVQIVRDAWRKVRWPKPGPSHSWFPPPGSLELNSFIR